MSLLRAACFSASFAVLAFGASCSSKEEPPASPAVDAGPSSTDSGDAAPEPIRPGLYPLLGVDPTLVAPDLDRLDPIVGDAQIVGIGESVHTTAGEYHLRLRILRHLIERRGFRAIAFESSWKGIADVMEPYVQTCAGTPEDAAKKLHPIWWDVSVPPFLTWLCQWNQAHPTDKVHVYGFDIRQPWSDAPAFHAYITAQKPAGGAALADGLSTCLGVAYADEAAFFADPKILEYYDGKTPTPEQPHTDCQAGAQAALADLATNRATYVGAAGEEAWDFARLAVAQVGAFDQTIYGLSRVRKLTDLQKPNHARDVAMYDAFKTLRKYRHPSLKTALWAHNGHVMRSAKTLMASQWTGVQSIGTSIAEEYGSTYVVIGQLSWQTLVNFPSGEDELPRPAPSSIEAALEKHEVDYLLLDLPEGTAGDPPAVPAGALEVGADPFTMVPAEHFDAFTWQRRSEGAKYFATPEP